MAEKEPLVEKTTEGISSRYRDIYPNFAPLVDACLDYAHGTGWRFKRADFENEKRPCTEIVENFRKRLVDENEKSLMQEFRLVDGICLKEVYLSSIRKTFESLELFKENKSIPKSEIHWEDMDQPLENIAAQFYNFCQDRPLTPDDVLVASFISDFAHAYGLKSKPEESERYRDSVQAFLKKVESYGEQTGKKYDMENITEHLSKFLVDNTGEILIIGAFGILGTLAYGALRKYRK